MKKYFLKMACVMLGCLSLSAWASADQVLRVSTKVVPGNLNYTDGQGLWNKEAILNLVEGLVAQDVNGDIIPAQALRWDIDNEKREILFHIRPEAKWSNGERVLAGDFVLAWQQLVDPKQKRRMNGLLRLVKNYREIRAGALPSSALGVRAVTDDQLLVQLEGATDLFLKMLIHHPTAPVYSRAASHFPDASKWESGEGHFFNGPYLPVDGEVLLTLEKNPHYYDSESLYFDKVVWGQRDTGALVSDVVMGKLDLGIAAIPKNMAWINENHPEIHLSKQSKMMGYMAFNKDSNVASMPGVIRAIGMTLERSVFKGKRFQGAIPLLRMNADEMYQSEDLPVPEWSNTDIEKRREEAARIMASYGYSGEKRLKIKMIDIHLYKDSNGVAFKAALKHIGIELEIEKVELSEYYQRLREGRYESTFIWWTKDFEDPYSHLSLLEADNSYYLNKYGNPKIDALLDEAIKIEDASEREKAYLEIEALNQKEPVLIPLFARPRLVVGSPKLKGVSAGFSNIPVRWMYKEE